MPRIDLLSGSCIARSAIANLQRCVNLWPEKNEPGAATELTFYQRPGLVPLASGPNAPVRALYCASNGQGFAAIGDQFYLVNPDWTLTNLGYFPTSSSGPMSFTDNGIELFAVDGQPAGGYTYNFSTMVAAQINDPTGTFVSGTRVGVLDTFMLWSFPNSNEFGSTLSNSSTPYLSFDPTYVAAKTGFPDHLSGIIVNRLYLLLLGIYKSEVWYDAGNAGFPFARYPGVALEEGCVATYSIVSYDTAVYWVSQDLAGQGMVLRFQNFQTHRISDHALEYALEQMGTLSDCIAYVHLQGGHPFVVFTFPTGDQTWVWDVSQEKWHQRGWTDPSTGVLHRERANCGAFINGKFVVGDWENGKLYQLAPATFTDNGAAVKFIRGFSHITSVMGPQGPVPVDGYPVLHQNFRADIQAGSVSGSQVILRYSDDRGKSWTADLLQPLADAPAGTYQTRPQWPGLGMAVDRLYELEWSAAGPAALNGAWLEATACPVG
jgi:hypothetical protein